MITEWAAGYWLPMFVNLCLQATVILTLAVFALLLYRKRSAALRHIIASTALCVLLLLPLFALAPPAHLSLTRWLPHARSNAYSMSPDEAGLSPAPARTVALPTVPQPTPGTPPAAAPAPTPATSIAGGARASTVAASRDALPPGAAVWMFAAWAAGCLFLLLRFAASYLRLHLVARRCPRVSNEALLESITATLHDAARPRDIALLQSTALAPIDVPVTWGVWHPVILLPQHAAAWPEARLRAVMLHEAAHIRRADWGVQTLAQLACALFWFHPLAWHLQRRMQEEAERACDDAVLVSGVTATEYAGHLLDVVRAVRRRDIPAAAVTMARHSQVSGRMQAILDTGRRRAPVNRRALCAATIAAAALLAPVTWLRPLAAQSASPRSGRRIEAAGLQSVWVQSALVPVSGPGIEVTLTDSKTRTVAGANPALIRDRDINTIVAALKAAGAEAVSIGDQRVGAFTVVRAYGADITVNAVQLHPPFVVRAIGNTDALFDALNHSGGPLAALRGTDSGTTRIAKAAVLNLPGLMVRRIEQQWARPVPGDLPDAKPGYAAFTNLRAFAGFTDVTGPGVTVTLSDSDGHRASGASPQNGLIHDSDVAGVIDQLRIGGAEAISVGDQRVVTTTAVQAIGPKLIVNGASVAGPYVIRAIGDPDLLIRALDRPDTATATMRRVDPAMVRVDRTPSLRLPAFTGGEPRYVRPVIVPMMAPGPEGGPSGQVINFDDGAGVELIGIGSSTSGDGDDWWKPDGTPLSESPVRTNNRFHNSYTGIGTQYLTRSFFFRLHSSRDVLASSTGYVVDPTGRLDTDGYHHGRDQRLNNTHLGPQRPASGAVIMGFPKSETRCAYRFGIATGPWETISVTQIPLTPAARTSRPLPASRQYSPVIQMNASPVIAYQDSQGKDHTQSLLGGHAPLGDVARRIVAIDPDGREVSIDEDGGDYRGDPRVEISEGIMARIAELRLQIRPYRWAEFRDIALQPIRGVAPMPIATPAPLPGLRHTFSGGLTISVVGVTERRSDGGRWWLPNGRPVPGPMKEFVSTLNFQGYRPTDRPRALLMRQSSNRDLNYSEAWQLVPESKLWKGINHTSSESGLLKNQPFSSFMMAEYPVGVQQCTVRLGIATQPWQTVGRLAMPANVRHNAVSPDSYDGDVTCYLANRPRLEYKSADGQPQSMAFLSPGKVLGNAARRIVAIDKLGKVVPLNAALSGSPDVGDIIPLSFADAGILRRYNTIDPASIKEFRLQTRPYEWAEFKDIHLDPGQ